MPAVIDDRTLPTPQSSYDIQKFIGEPLAGLRAARPVPPETAVALVSPITSLGV